jgi:hypothetical protein
MPLKLEQWDMLSNGFKAKFHPQSIDANGNLKGVILEGTKSQPIEGFWNEDAKRVTFLRVIDAAKPSTAQVYTGYLMGDNQLAGVFKAFKGTGASRDRSEFAWSALLPPKIG